MVGQKKSGGQQKRPQHGGTRRQDKLRNLKKAIIQEVAERSNTTEQRTVSVSQRRRKAGLPRRDKRTVQRKTRLEDRWDRRGKEGRIIRWQ